MLERRLLSGMAVAVASVLAVVCASMPLATQADEAGSAPRQRAGDDTPELRLLTACREQFASLTQRVHAKHEVFTASLPPLAHVAWLDNERLWVRTEWPGRGDAQRIASFLWPIGGAPVAATRGESRKHTIGTVPIWESCFQAGAVSVTQWAHSWTMLRLQVGAAQGMSPTDAQEVVLEDLLVVDLARATGTVGRDEGREDKIVIYGGDGRQLARCGRPTGLRVDDASDYAVFQRAEEYVLAVPSVANRSNAQTEQPDANLTVMHVPKSAAGVVRSRVVASLQGTLNTGDPQQVRAARSLERPNYSPTRGRWLYRQREEIVLRGESVALVQLWCVDEDGERSHLLDMLGWYHGPRRRNLLFSISSPGQFSERATAEGAFGPYGDLIPAVSPDGLRVAYIKGDTVCIADVP